MPEAIKTKFPSTRVIIDSTEIKVETPSSLVLVSELFSTYKNHVTLKALIGCSPSAVAVVLSVSFILEAFQMLHYCQTKWVFRIRI